MIFLVSFIGYAHHFAVRSFDPKIPYIKYFEKYEKLVTRLKDKLLNHRNTTDITWLMAPPINYGCSKRDWKKTVRKFEAEYKDSKKNILSVYNDKAKKVFDNTNMNVLHGIHTVGLRFVNQTARNDGTHQSPNALAITR